MRKGIVLKRYYAFGEWVGTFSSHLITEECDLGSAEDAL
jgi:hypothetical protein